MPYESYFAGREAIFRNHRGRPRWGKIHDLGARDLRDMYPQWERFQEIRRQLDPKGVFLNDHLFGARAGHPIYLQYATLLPFRSMYSLQYESIGHSTCLTVGVHTWYLYVFGMQ